MSSPMLNYVQNWRGGEIDIESMVTIRSYEQKMNLLGLLLLCSKARELKSWGSRFKDDLIINTVQVWFSLIWMPCPECFCDILHRTSLKEIEFWSWLKLLCRTSWLHQQQFRFSKILIAHSSGDAEEKLENLRFGQHSKEEGLRIYIHSSNTRKSSVDIHSSWVANGLVCTWSNQPW